MRARLLVVASLLAPAAAMAAVEVTPQVGYRAGGLEINTGIVCVQPPCPSFAESENRPLFGAIVGVPLSEDFQFELLLNRQPTKLAFSDSRQGPNNGLPTVDFDVTHLHAGIMRHWELSSFEPFVVLGAGQTWIDSSSMLSGNVDVRRWSGSVGGGARVPLGTSDRYGLRLEARGYLVDLPSNRVVGNEFVTALEGDLTQIETTAGVTIRF